MLHLVKEGELLAIEVGDEGLKAELTRWRRGVPAPYKCKELALLAVFLLQTLQGAESARSVFDQVRVVPEVPNDRRDQLAVAPQRVTEPPDILIFSARDGFDDSHAVQVNVAERSLGRLRLRQGILHSLTRPLGLVYLSWLCRGLLLSHGFPPSRLRFCGSPGTRQAKSVTSVSPPRVIAS